MKEVSKYGGEGTDHMEGCKDILEAVLPIVVGTIYLDKSRPMANFRCHA